jgi:hypothetical protein
MNNIDKHIEQDREILDNPTTSPQQRRHVEDELESLKSYKAKHPDNDQDPTPLELFCDEHPDASECRVYDI